MWALPGFWQTCSDVVETYTTRLSFLACLWSLFAGFFNLFLEDCCLIACAGWLLVLQSGKTGQWSAWHLIILGWQIYSRRNLHQLIACCICQRMEDCQVINIHMSQGFPWQRHELMRRCLTDLTLRCLTDLTTMTCLNLCLSVVKSIQTFLLKQDSFKIRGRD